MTAHVKGSMKVTAGGKEYTLFVGMSVLADLQAKHGQDVLEKLDEPAGTGKSWMPDLAIVTDLFMGALGRYHGEEADRWIVDDIIAENADALPQLMGASFPDTPKGKPAGNAKRPKAAA
jgi:hypothetical protein